MSSGVQETTAGGNLRAPSLAMVCEWISSAWWSIPAETIVKSFVVCGVNKPDGSEDHLVNFLEKTEGAMEQFQQQFHSQVPAAAQNEDPHDALYPDVSMEEDFYDSDGSVEFE